MVQETREQVIIIEMVLIKIMVVIVIKLQHKGTGEQEVNSTASDAWGGDILVESVQLC